jgi:glycosidase
VSAGARNAAGPPTGEALAALAQPGADSALATERIYFVMTDRYADGDPSNDTGGLAGGRNVTGYDPTSAAWWHGGDFRGLTGGCTDPVHGLQRIKDLGFNAIWVTPAVMNQVSQGSSGGYHGYWGIDFTKVDPHLGTDQDFADFVSCAHELSMRVILDVVVNHTGDVIQLKGRSTYSSAPFRDCHGKAFDPARYVGGSTFPCMSVRFMPQKPVVPAALAQVKKPAWLDDLTNYHDRGEVDFSSCNAACYEQGDVYGLDDLFTEKPVVEKGLAQIYSDWVTQYKLDGFRVDTARHLNAGFFKLWVPQILAAARAAGVNDFQIFGEAPITDGAELATYVRDRGLPSMLDFPFQSAATGYASGAAPATAVQQVLRDDDYFRGPDGVDPTPPTFLGNHDMGRAAYEISQAGLSGNALFQHLRFAYDLMYLLRGAPVVYYGDEVGMIGTGGDQAARQDMFPTQVPDWQTQPRVGSPPIGTGSSFDVTNNPIELELKQLGALRDANPALATGATIVRLAKGGLLAISRIDAAGKREYLELFNNGAAQASATVTTATPSSTWTALLGGGSGVSSDSAGRLTVQVPAVGAVLLRADAQIPVAAVGKPKLTVAGDPLSTLWAVSAAVPGSAPVTVSFAVRRAGSATWTRLDVDDSPPYRAFLDPARFKKNERVNLVAIARGLDGSTAVSAVVPFRVHAR